MWNGVGRCQTKIGPTAVHTKIRQSFHHIERLLSSRASALSELRTFALFQPSVPEEFSTPGRAFSARTSPNDRWTRTADKRVHRVQDNIMTCGNTASPRVYVQCGSPSARNASCFQRYRNLVVTLTLNIGYIMYQVPGTYSSIIACFYCSARHS